ncbi:MAG: hypothetical protein AAB654_07295 [Acidobacteriota bacterium]
MVCLDALEPWQRDKLEYDAGGEARLCIDWRALLATLGFDSGERTLLLGRLAGEGRVKLAERMGKQVVERARKGISRKLKRLRASRVDVTEATTILRSDPSRTAVQVRLHGGGVLWEHR